MRIKNALVKLIPFELKRSTSWLSIIIALILAGIITEIGKIILIGIIKLIGMVFEIFGDKLIQILSQTYEVNLATIIIGALVFIILLFPIYRKIDKLILTGVKKELIFEEDFTNSVSWRLNHWGSHNPSKTNRIENHKMIFEATPEELQDPNKFFGANFDLRNGIYSGNTYEISCIVNSMKNATMKFQLWVHDTAGGDSSVSQPKTPTTPSETGETMQTSLYCQQNQCDENSFALSGWEREN
jgi:hypothetical protein